MFNKYPHLVKYGHEEVEGIEFGLTHVFPKIDGTNASVWFDERIRAGSRNRELDTVNFEQDNAGFAQWASKQEALANFFAKYPTLRLYGEWLVPHTITHYRQEAWRRFYIFDVMEGDKFLPYDTYLPILMEFGLDVVPCIKKFKNGDWESFMKEAHACTYLLDNPDTTTLKGEGIVIKNYEWENKYKNITWAKIVLAEFKEQHVSKMGANVIENKTNAEAICDIACTEALIEKEYQKILQEVGTWEKKFIPRLLNVVFYSVVKEELWNCLKKINNGSVNFKELQSHCFNKVKQTKKELFI